MSNAVENIVYEAELVADVTNPYQGPNAVEQQRAEISDGIGRATPEEIANTKNAIVAAEVSYIIVSISQIAFLIANAEFSFVGPIFFGASSLAFFCFAWMVLCCNKLDLLTLATVFAFAIPVIGSFLFLAAKKQAIRFLIWNGYRPVFLGAVPDHDEIRNMNEDPHYRPATLFHPNGSKRKIPWSLSDSFLLAVAVFGFAAIVVGLIPV